MRHAPNHFQDALALTRPDYLANIKQDRHTYLSSQSYKRNLTKAETQELYELDCTCMAERHARAFSEFLPFPMQQDDHIRLYRARKAADRAIMGLVGGIV